MTLIGLPTNTIEGFSSLIERGIVGSYRKVSRTYLPLYVSEFHTHPKLRTLL
jgi:hypothetical protein